MECKAKGCKTTKGVKIYCLFCGIKIAYCPKHNYLFRDIQILNQISQGSFEKMKQQEQTKQQNRKERKNEKWQKIPII